MGPRADQGNPGRARAGRRRVGAVALVLAAIVTLVFGVWQWRVHQSMANGRSLLAHGEYVSATRALLRVVAARPEDARAHYDLGLAYSGMGLYEGALSQLKEAVRLAPDEARFHAGLGRVYRETGEIAVALGEFEEAVRRDPREPRYRVELAGILLDQSRVPEAIRQLRQAAALRPDSPPIHLLLAHTLRRLGDNDGMVGEYREVIRLAAGTAVGELARQELSTGEAVLAQTKRSEETQKHKGGTRDEP